MVFPFVPRKSFSSGSESFYDFAVRNLPEAVGQFIVDFDKGMYPDLVEGSFQHPTE